LQVDPSNYSLWGGSAGARMAAWLGSYGTAAFGEAEYPRLSVSAESYSNNYRLSDFWKRDGAYLRLKSMSLGYTLPGRITRKAGIQGLRFFVTGTNLLTLTAFKYLDPESPNVVTGYYPQQRTFTFGLDLSF